MGVAVVSGGIAIAAWTQLGERTQPVPAGSASASSSASPSANPPVDTSATASARPVITEAPLPAWMASVREGQAAIATGDLKLAQKYMKEAFDKGGGHGVPRTMLEHLSVAATSAATDRGACKLTGLARPRTFDLGMPASARPVGSGRPSITMGPRGAVITWNDAHDSADHAYTVVLDDAMRNTATPIDVTPEALSVARPELRRAGDKLVLLYADHKGPEAGVHARFLDADGRIASAAVQVSPPKAGSYYPSMAAAPDGSYFVSWSDETDNDSEDLFFRHLGPDLAPIGDPIRATDLIPAGPTKARARFPSLAVAGDALLATFRLERDPARLIEHMRVPLADAAKGLEPLKKGDKKVDRMIGEVVLVNTDKSKADGPILACGGTGCFIVWHGEQNGGASEAVVDPTKAQPLSRRKFAKTGAHPSVAMSPGGQAQLVWYESGKVVTAPLSRDGIGTPSRIARISGEQPPAAIVAGNKPGEWYLAWLDYETGHLEAYAARVQCK
jgi:serine/threonine-protein kinase